MDPKASRVGRGKELQEREKNLVKLPGLSSFHPSQPSRHCVGLGAEVTRVVLSLSFLLGISVWAVGHLRSWQPWPEQKYEDDN